MQIFIIHVLLFRIQVNLRYATLLGVGTWISEVVAFWRFTINIYKEECQSRDWDRAVFRKYTVSRGAVWFTCMSCRSSHECILKGLRKR